MLLRLRWRRRYGWHAADAADGRDAAIFARAIRAIMMLTR